MADGPAVQTHEAAAPSAALYTAPPRRRRWLLAAVVVVVAVAVVAVTDPFTRDTPVKAGVTDNAAPISLATVVRRDLSSQTELSGTLGYAGSYTVIYQAVADQAASTAGPGASGTESSATFTWLPATGQVISQGQAVYDVDGAPVALLYGSTPAYRSLSENMTGTDVAELNTDLVALGYATTAEIPAGSDTFTWWTKYGIQKLQAALGVTQTGTLTLGQAVFLPTAARVTSLTAVLGGAAQPGATVLAATSTSRQVSVALDASQQPEMAADDKVSIVLPNNQTTPGVVSSVGTVATTPSSDTSTGSGSGSATTGSGSGSTPTVTVLVTPTDPAATGDWDQAPVDVTITTANVPNAEVVPVDALLALAAGGGYAVEVVGAGGIHRVVTVTLGTFDDAAGLVQVTSSGLTVGEKVVVPAND